MGRVLKALRFLQPRQQNSGAGAVQVDRAGRDVQVQQVTQHQPVTHVHVVQHIYGAPPEAAAPPADSGASAARPPPGLKRNARALQREALHLMDALSLDRRVAVLAFMRREFGTDRVLKLEAGQCYRLKRYLQQVINNQERAERIDRESHKAIDSTAPPLGRAVDRDLASSAAESLPPAFEPPQLSELQARLDSARAALWSRRMTLFVNWPALLLVVVLLSMTASLLYLVLSGRLFSDNFLSFKMVFGWAIAVAGLSWRLERTRKPVQHVVADLRAEVYRLERAVALRQAGRR